MLTKVLSRGKNEPPTETPISPETDPRLARVAAKRREKEALEHSLRSQLEALTAASRSPTDGEAIRLARLEALLNGDESAPRQMEEPRRQELKKQLAEAQTDVEDLRQLEQRELARVSHEICAERAPAHRRDANLMAAALLEYNAGAESAQALHEALYEAGIFSSLRPVGIKELGLLRDEYSRISLFFRELKEYGLLDAELEQRALAAGWRV